MRSIKLTAIVLPGVLLCREAAACKCAPDREFADLARDHVIFAGRAMEKVRRCWHFDTERDRDEQRSLADTGAVTRFRVTYSRDSAPGAERLVFTNPYSNCAPYFRVGEEEIVIAYRVEGFLFASGCPHVFEGLARQVRWYLNVPSESLLGLRESFHAYVPSDCKRPASVQEAFDAANAVVWGDSVGACVV